MDYDYVFKIIILGDTFVGKSNLINHYFKKDIKPSSTIGLDLHRKVVCIDDKNIAIQFWDTSGQERYKSLTSSYYKDAKGVFILYDITNKESFSSVDFWINDIKEKCNEIIIIIIGNKNDLEKMRKIKKEEGEKKAKLFNAYFFEISSFSKENVNTVFKFMIDKVYENNKNLFDENENESDELEIKKINKCC